MNDELFTELQDSGLTQIELLRKWTDADNCMEISKDKIILLLAMCVKSENESKKIAYSKLNDICILPNELFKFIEYCEQISKIKSKSSGWGRAHKRAIANWYNSKTPKQLEYIYSSSSESGNWSHKDIIRLCHIKPNQNSKKFVLAVLGKCNAVIQNTCEYARW